MSTVELSEDFLRGGLRTTNYVNGARLTAEHLRDDHRAHRLRHRQLGQAIGEGVVHGLTVSLGDTGARSSRSTLLIRGGLALGPDGTMLVLPEAVELDLLGRRGEPAVVKKSDDGRFVPCEEEPAPTSPAAFTGTGVYLLVMGSASGFADDVVKGCFEGGGVAPGCGNRYSVEGVRFRLVRVDAKLDEVAEPDDLASLSRLRNLLAYACFGTADLADFFCHPFHRIGDRSAFASYGPLDRLRARGVLGEDEVALALLYWSEPGIRFLDNWAVRRCVRSSCASELWPLDVGARRVSESEAMLLQFQDHLDWLLGKAQDPTGIRARDYFCYLPPGGYLPTGAGEIRLRAFLSDLSYREGRLDAGFVRFVIHKSFYLEPIDLHAREAVPLWAYHPENCCCRYVIYLRDEKCLEGICEEGELTAKAPSIACPGSVKDSRIDVDVCVDDSQPQRSTCGERVRENVDILVRAENEVGRVYPGRFVRPGTDFEPGGGGEVRFRNRVASFSIPSLPPGRYRVKVRMRGFREASRLVDLCDPVCLTFKLVPEEARKGCCEQVLPVTGIPGSWLGPGWYHRLVPIYGSVRWPWTGVPTSEWVGQPQGLPPTDVPPGGTAAAPMPVAPIEITPVELEPTEITPDTGGATPIEPIPTEFEPIEIPPTEIVPEEAVPPEEPPIPSTPEVPILPVPPNRVPPQVPPYLYRVSDWIHCHFPNCTLDPAGSVYFNAFQASGWLQGRVAEHPHGYFTYGDTGVPFVAIPNEYAFRTPLGQAAHVVTDIHRFTELGVQDLETVAALPSRLVRERFGWSREVAECIIQSVRKFIVTGGLRLVPGVTAEIAAVLPELNIRTIRDLALANPGDLTEVGIDLDTAKRIVSEACARLPDVSKSLNAIDVGSVTVDRLVALGIRMPAALVQKVETASPDELKRIRTKLDMSDSELTGLAGRIRVLETNVDIERAATVPVMKLDIPFDRAVRLESARLGTIGDVVRITDPASLVEVYDGDVVRTEDLRTSAWSEYFRIDRGDARALRETFESVDTLALADVEDIASRLSASPETAAADAARIRAYARVLG